MSYSVAKCCRSFETKSTGREGVVVSKFWTRRLVRPKRHKTPMPARIMRQYMLLLVATKMNCLQWGRSNLVDPAGILSNFSWEKNSKTESSLNFLQSGPPKFTKSKFSGLAPIRWALSRSEFFELRWQSLAICDIEVAVRISPLGILSRNQ